MNRASDILIAVTYEKVIRMRVDHSRHGYRLSVSECDRSNLSCFLVQLIVEVGVVRANLIESERFSRADRFRLTFSCLVGMRRNRAVGETNP